MALRTSQPRMRTSNTVSQRTDAVRSDDCIPFQLMFLLVRLEATSYAPVWILQCV